MVPTSAASVDVLAFFPGPLQATSDLDLTVTSWGIEAPRSHMLQG